MRPRRTVMRKRLKPVGARQLGHNTGRQRKATLAQREEHEGLDGRGGLWGFRHLAAFSRFSFLVPRISTHPTAFASAASFGNAACIAASSVLLKRTSGSSTGTMSSPNMAKPRYRSSLK